MDTKTVQSTLQSPISLQLYLAFKQSPRTSSELSPRLKKCWHSNRSLPRLVDRCLMTIEYHIKGLAKKLISLV